MPDDRTVALPAAAYRDPAEYVASKQMVELGCRACSNAWIMDGRVACTEPRKTDHKGIPRIGPNCKYFKLKGL